MSKPFVADASVAAVWAVETQSTAACDQLLVEIESGRDFIVPALWPLEIANILLALQRRNRITPAHRKSALRDLQALRPEIDYEGMAECFGRVSELAEKHGLSVYDAAYLGLALRRAAPLATRDGALRKAAMDCGVEVVF